MVAHNIPVEPYAVGLPATAESLLLQHEVEQLLYLEARLLDDWNLDAWLTLYTPDARYVVPTTDLPEGDPASDLVFIDDDYRRMQGRGGATAKSARSPGVPVVTHPPVHLQRDGDGTRRERT